MVRGCARAAGSYFAAQALPPPLARVLGPALRARFLHYARQTTARALARCTRHPMLAAVLAGQDASICGVTGALMGAVITASVVLRRNLLGVVTKP